MKNGSKKLRVLAIGMYDSPHFSRWLAQFADSDIDFLLLPSSPHRRIHHGLQTLLSNNTVATFRTIGPVWLMGLPTWAADRLFQNLIRALILKWCVSRNKPQIIHALEIQNAGYILLKFLKINKSAKTIPRLYLTNYGSDIYWFSRSKAHRSKIQSLLASVDAYSCECERDLNLAKNLGYEGEVMPIVPNAGGLSDDECVMEIEDFNLRQSIAVKGYEGWAGQAVRALDAIEAMSSELRQFKIEVYSCNYKTIRKARSVRRKSGLEICCYRKGALSHSETLQLFRRSRIYLGVSRTDGISTSMLEAMASGAIPVQTATSCCEEWFTKSGIVLLDTSIETIQNGIRGGIRLASDLSNAELNLQTIRTKAGDKLIRKRLENYYR